MPGGEPVLGALPINTYTHAQNIYTQYRTYVHIYTQTKYKTANNASISIYMKIEFRSYKTGSDRIATSVIPGTWK